MNNHKPKSFFNLDRLLIFLILFFSISFSVIMIWASAEMIDSVKPDAEFNYSKITDSSSLYCPGDEMHFIVSFTVHRSPLIMRTVENTYSIAEKRNVVPDTEYTFFIRNETGTFESPMVYTIPDLKPGEYEYRRGFDQSTKRSSITIIHFTVPENCPKK